MNVDRGKESFTPEEVSELRDRLNAYKTYESLSWARLADLIGKDQVGGSTLSAWANDTYKGDNRNIAFLVNKYFLSEEARAEVELQAPIIPGFLFTRTARAIIAQCRWAHRGKIVVAVGAAGIGKTGALRQYAATTPNAFHAEMYYGARSPKHLLQELLYACGALSALNGSVQSLTHLLCDRLKDARALLMVDEAQHLNDEALDLLRHLNDRIGVGILLSGNPEVLTRIGSRKASFAQVHSRISLPHVYDKPFAEDVETLLDAWGVRNLKEREYLAGVASMPGAVRLMTQVLELATLTAGKDEERTLSHLKDAFAQHQLTKAA